MVTRCSASWQISSIVAPLATTKKYSYVIWAWRARRVTVLLRQSNTTPKKYEALTPWSSRQVTSDFHVGVSDIDATTPPRVMHSKHCLACTQKRLSDNRQRCLRIQNVPPCNPEQSRTLPVCAQNTHVRSRTPYRSNQPHPLVVFLVLDVVATCKQFSPWKRRINRHISHKCYLEISLGNLNSNRSNHC